jgi:DNA-binding MurR/RpiR family transcriptional regulator
MSDSTKKEFFERIIRLYPSLSTKKKRIADLIIQDYKKLFLAARHRRRVRWRTHLFPLVLVGFLRVRGVRQYVSCCIQLTSVERMLKSTRRTARQTSLRAYYQNTLQNLEHLIHSISEQEIKNLARKIFQSEFVLVAGYRASSILASYFVSLKRSVRG